MRQSNLFPQITWFAHPFRHIFQIRDSPYRFYGDGVLETVVANVPQPFMLETMIVLHYVLTGVRTD